MMRSAAIALVVSAGLAVSASAAPLGFQLIAEHNTIDSSLFVPDALDQTLELVQTFAPPPGYAAINGLIFSGFLLPADTAVFVSVQGSSFGFGFAFNTPNHADTWAVWGPGTDQGIFVPEYYEIHGITLRLGINCQPPMGTSHQCAGWLPASDRTSVAALTSGTIRLATFSPPNPIPEPAAFVAFALGLGLLTLHRCSARRPE